MTLQRLRAQHGRAYNALTPNQQHAYFLGLQLREDLCGERKGYPDIRDYIETLKIIKFVSEVVK